MADVEVAEQPPPPSNTYVIRPNFQHKFRPVIVKECIHNVLNEHLDGKTYDPEEIMDWTKAIADNIKTKLKEPCLDHNFTDMGYDRYKFVVQVAIGEQRGEGVKMGARCFWDSDTDNYAQDIYINSQTKIKERKNRLLSKATGGGPPPRPLVDWEEMIINAMPNEVIEGLVGGTDTFCELNSRAKENTNTNKKSPVIVTNEEPGSSTGIMSEDYINNEENKKGKGKATKRKVQESTSLQERLIDIEEKKMKLKEEKLKIEKEKVETLKKISENISKIHILMKHKFIEDEDSLFCVAAAFGVFYY